MSWLNSEGYLVVHFDGKPMMEHRVIWFHNIMENGPRNGLIT